VVRGSSLCTRRTGDRNATVAMRTQTSTPIVTSTGSRSHHRVTANETIPCPTSRTGRGRPAASASRTTAAQAFVSWASASTRRSVSAAKTATAVSDAGTPIANAPAPTMLGTDQPLRRPIPINEPKAPAATAEVAG
jgi:hypothetical protein